MIVTMTTLKQELNNLKNGGIEYAREVNANREYPYSIKKVNGKFQVYNGYFDDPKNKLFSAGCEDKPEFYNTEEEARNAIYQHLINSAEISIKAYIWSGTDCC